MVKQRTLFSLEQLKFQALTRRIKYRTIKITTDFKNKLKETKKLAYLYGNLSFNTIERTAKRATTLSGKQMHNFAIILESRLDVILYRIRFFKTIPTAREWISNGWVLVNGNPVTVHSYELRAGDVLSIIPEKHYLLHQEIISDITKKFSYSCFLSTKKIDKKNRYLNNVPSCTRFGSVRFYLTKPFLRKASPLFLTNQRMDFLAPTNQRFAMLTNLRFGLLLTNRRFVSQIYDLLAAGPPLRNKDLLVAAPNKSKICRGASSLNQISYLYKTPLTVRRILNKTYLLKSKILNKNRSLFRIRYYKRKTYLSASRALIRASMFWHLYKNYLLNGVSSTKRRPLLLNKKPSVYFSPSKNINRGENKLYFQTIKGASYFKKHTTKTNRVWKNVGLRLKQKTSRKGYFWLSNKNQNRLIAYVKNFQSYMKRKQKQTPTSYKFLSSKGQENGQSKGWQLWNEISEKASKSEIAAENGSSLLRKEVKFGKKIFFNNSKYNIKKRYRFGGQKPINMEVSYKTLTAVYLYSPQVLFYPALIDFDYILRRVWRK